MGEEKQRGAKSKRGRLALALCLAVLVAYSLAWHYLAGQAEKQFLAAAARAEETGAQLRCGDLSKSGYPLRIGLSCADFAFYRAGNAAAAPKSAADISALLNNGGAGAGGALALHSGGLEAGAPVYAPHWIVAEMRAPAKLKLPYGPVVSADWQSLRAEGDFAAPKPQDFSLNAERLSVSGLPAALPGHALEADFIRAESRRLSGDKAKITLSFDNLALPFALPRASAPLPRADGEADIEAENAAAFYADAQSFLQTGKTSLLRGKSVRLNHVALSFENGGGISLSGPLSVSDSGLVSGTVSLAAQDPAALMRTMRALFPAQADNLESLFFVLSSMPKNARGEPMLELSLQEGKIRMGFLRLGRLPPL